jgi:hypothetical protein
MLAVFAQSAILAQMINPESISEFHISSSSIGNAVVHFSQTSPANNYPEWSIRSDRLPPDTSILDKLAVQAERIAELEIEIQEYRDQNGLLRSDLIARVAKTRGIGKAKFSPITSLSAVDIHADANPMLEEGGNFEPDAQLSPLTSPSVSPLANVRSIAKPKYETSQARSQADRGAVAKVKRTVVPDNPAVENSHGKEINRNEVFVLIVDSSKDWRAVIKELLDSERIRSLACKTVEDALSKISLGEQGENFTSIITAGMNGMWLDIEEAASLAGAKTIVMTKSTLLLNDRLQQGDDRPVFLKKDLTKKSSNHAKRLIKEVLTEAIG